MTAHELAAAGSSLWIFGYGSLVWKPNFRYNRSHVGFIRGFKRRFWQGDPIYRGNDEMPARVVTILEENDACTWGMAFEVIGSQIQEAFDHLHMRESEQNGYSTDMVEFIPHDKNQPSVQAVAYIAKEDNPSYLGPASLEEIAVHIVACKGKTGSNIEYLLHLAEFMRQSCPGVDDSHLFSLEKACLAAFRPLTVHCPTACTCLTN